MRAWIAAAVMTVVLCPAGAAASGIAVTEATRADGPAVAGSSVLAWMQGPLLTVLRDGHGMQNVALPADCGGSGNGLRSAHGAELLIACGNPGGASERPTRYLLWSPSRGLYALRVGLTDLQTFSFGELGRYWIGTTVCDDHAGCGTAYLDRATMTMKRVSGAAARDLDSRDLRRVGGRCARVRRADWYSAGYVLSMGVDGAVVRRCGGAGTRRTICRTRCLDGSLDHGRAVVLLGRSRVRVVNARTGAARSWALPGPFDPQFGPNAGLTARRVAVSLAAPGGGWRILTARLPASLRV
jgi:hypothetical protein